MKRRQKKLRCMTEHQAMRVFYRNKLRFGSGFSVCRIYNIKSRAPTGRSVAPEVNRG